jgi:hypothetical protein
VIWKITKVNANTTTTTAVAATPPPTTKSTGSLADYTFPPLPLTASKAQAISNTTSTASNQTSSQATPNLGTNVTTQRNNTASSPTGIPGAP